MKNKITISITLIALMLFSVNTTQAAFPIKKASSKAVTTANQENKLTATSVLTSANELSTIQTENITKKQSFLTKLTNKISHAGGAKISQGAYIVLAIFWLGWLAMGINDDWQGSDWLISLVLYILFWLPGFVYTLVMMGKYY